MKGLLLVDIQNDFLPGGALEVAEGNQIISIVNELMKKDFDVVIASRDWHPRDHVSFAENHGRIPGEIIEVGGIKQILWPIHCVGGDWGSDFAPDLEINNVDKIFYKGRDKYVDSYSAFFDSGKQRSTGLEDYLKKHNITELYIVGLATEYCIKYSVLDSLFLGFATHVILDACRGVELNKGDCQRAVKKMEICGAKIISSEDV